MPVQTEAPGEAPPPPGPPALVLEFALDPEAAARLPRHPALAAARSGRRSRAAPEELIWLDTPEGLLAAEGLALERPRRGPPRRLSILAPADATWLPGTPPAPCPEPEAGPEADAAGPPGLVPIAAFSGRRTLLPLGTPEAPLQAELLSGKLRAVAAERPVARLRLAGGVAPVLGLARRLAADLPLLPTAAALAEEGRALARGERPRARRRGPPDLGAAETVEAALLAALGHLLEVMLHYQPRCRPDAGPEGVHQTRVALRRLRSVLKAFKPAAGCAATAAFDDGLKGLAQRLGAARDLDVFLTGLGAEAAEAMPGERRIGQLLRTAEARRLAAYAALREALDGPGFRALVLDGIALMLERPWRELAAAAPDAAPRGAEALDEPLPAFASRLLDKRWHRLCSEGEEIHRLDAEALHELRLTAKRLRYAAELFAPLWPGKAQRRFLKRLAAVQEELGLANDVEVARALVAGLGSGVPAWAVGAMEGFAAAKASGARRRGLSAWEDLMVAKPFWSDL